jgi:hypothetical protein
MEEALRDVLGKTLAIINQPACQRCVEAFPRHSGLAGNRQRLTTAFALLEFPACSGQDTRCWRCESTTVACWFAVGADTPVQDFLFREMFRIIIGLQASFPVQ